MSVLIVSPFFYPEPISTGRYNTVLAQELVRSGAVVEVIASHPLYPDWKPYHSSAQLPGMHILRGGAWLRYPRPAVLRRLLLEVWFTIHAAAGLRRLHARPNRVVAIFPPCAFMLLLPLLLPRGAVKIGIVHDLQGVLAERGGGAAGRVLRNLIRGIEKRAFLACDRLVFLSTTMAERAIAEYSLDRSRCSIRYPFLTLPQQVSPDGAGLEALLPAGAVHVVYSGALGEKQEPGRLVAFMEELARRHSGLYCHVFSGGPIFERLRAAAAGGSRVRFHSLVAEAALDELYARCTVQLLPQARGAGDGCLPSKLPNLLAAGVPVFAVCDDGSEIAALLEQVGGSGAAFAAGFDAPELHVRFEAFLADTAQESREARIARQSAFVQQHFGVDGVLQDILS